MDTIYEFSQALNKMSKHQNYDGLLGYFKEHKIHYKKEEIANNEFVVYNVLLALISKAEYNAVFLFISSYDIEISHKNFQYLLKRIKVQIIKNWSFISKFCDLVNHKELEDTCNSIEVERKGVLKTIELSSFKEEWYTIKTKALFENKQYQECCNFSKEAMREIKKMHFSNEIWFARKIALSLDGMGQRQAALEEMHKILKKKKEWFLEYEIASIYFKEKQYEKAFSFAIAGLTNFGHIEYKVGLIVLMAEIQKQKRNDELAFLHLSLAKLLRIKNQWNIPYTITEALQNFENKKPIAENDLPNIKRQLISYWRLHSVKRDR